MDRYSSYSSFYPANAEGVDEVPSAHHTTGIAITLDLLYNNFIESDLDKYYSTLFRHTYAVFSHGKQYACDKDEKKICGVIHGWSHQYVHNHAATNGLSLYISALVLEKQISRISNGNSTSKELADKVKG